MDRRHGEALEHGSEVFDHVQQSPVTHVGCKALAIMVRRIPDVSKPGPSSPPLRNSSIGHMDVFSHEQAAAD